MKKNSCIFIVICLLFLPKINIYGQEFSFKMFFEDSAGNRDTITIGYDPLGTDGIDSQLGEINIIDIPLDTMLDVRITNEWNSRFISNISGTFHTKKQITEKKNCGDAYTINSIDVFTKNWPVTVSWDTTLFTDICLEGSLFTSIMPYGWWDTGGFLKLLANSGVSSFVPNEQTFSEYYSYVNNSNDTIDVFWQTFGDTTLFTNSVNQLCENQNIKIYPNPTNSLLNIDFQNDNNNQNTTIEIVDINGRIVLKTDHISTPIQLDSKHLNNGLYLIKIQNNKTLFTKRVIIQHN